MAKRFNYILKLRLCRWKGRWLNSKTSSLLWKLKIM